MVAGIYPQKMRDGERKRREKKGCGLEAGPGAIQIS